MKNKTRKFKKKIKIPKWVVMKTNSPIKSIITLWNTKIRIIYSVSGSQKETSTKLWVFNANKNSRDIKLKRKKNVKDLLTLVTSLKIWNQESFTILIILYRTKYYLVQIYSQLFTHVKPRMSLTLGEQDASSSCKYYARIKRKATPMPFLSYTLEPMNEMWWTLLPSTTDFILSLLPLCSNNRRWQQPRTQEKPRVVTQILTIFGPTSEPCLMKLSWPIHTTLTAEFSSS